MKMRGIEALRPTIESFPENYHQEFQMPASELGEKCGVLGWLARDNPDADLSRIQQQFLEGARALQHRGQQRTGIRGISRAGEIISHIGKGSVKHVFPEGQKFDLGVEESGVIHTTWTTDSSPGAKDASHPFMIERGNRKIIISHNGQLLEPLNADNKHPNDTGALAHKLDEAWAAQQVSDPFEVISSVLSEIDGSYSIVAKFIDGDDEFMYAFRDPRAIRPFVCGINDNGVVIASETGALDVFSADQIGEIDPGYIYRFDRYGEMARKKFAEAPRKSCIFENIYLTRKTHIDRGIKVEDQRRRAGELIAESFTEEEVAEIHANSKDYIVVPMPATAIPSAQGFAGALDLKYEPDAVKISDKYRRSYINGDGATVNAALEDKFEFDPEKIEGKRILVVDDSLVRGSTSQWMVKKLESLGVVEIHLLLASPRIENSCNLGADIKREVLMAPGKTNQEILQALQGENKEERKESKLKSVRYLSLDKLITAIGQPAEDLCTGCINGDYATNYPIKFIKGALERWQIFSRNFDIPEKPKERVLVNA